MKNPYDGQEAEKNFREISNRLGFRMGLAFYPIKR